MRGLIAIGPHVQRAVIVEMDGQRQDAVDLQDGDAFLLCTDGLWEWVDEDGMEQALAASRDSRGWLAALCARADAAARGSDKSRDTYSAFAIRVRHQESPT